jgi:hypothetical protein
VNHRSACVASVTAIVIAAGLAVPRRLSAGPPDVFQTTESKQPSQADVEMQLARMLEELRRENARRGVTEILTSPPAASAPAVRPAAPPTDAIAAPPMVAAVADAPRSVVTRVMPSGLRSPLPAIEGFIAADVQSFLGVPSTVQQGPKGTVVWHYLTPTGRQLVYFVDGVATVTAPTATPPVPPVRRTPGLQGECVGVTAATGFKIVAVANAEAPVFIEPKFKTQPLTELPPKKTAEVVSAEGAWYLIRFNDERGGRRVGYIHCSDVIRQEN